MIMSTAAKSLSHHGNHMEANFTQLTFSVRLKVPTPTLTPAPTLAPMAVANMAISTNLAIRVGAAKALRPSAQRLTKKPPANASNALPAAVAAAA